MKGIIVIFVTVLFFSCSTAKTVTIDGHVSDFDGNFISSSDVILMNKDFTPAYETQTDENGYFVLKNVEKGKYMALLSMRMEEYPRENKVPEEDMRLEYWSWNVIADRDLTINPRYHKLELYGTNVFKVMGGYNGYFIYFRPMSLTKIFLYGNEALLNKEESEQEDIDISVKQEYLNVNIYADEKKLKINSITPIDEYVGEDMILPGYIVQVDPPEVQTDRSYIIFRIEVENKENNEKGENTYFYEIKNYR